MKSHNLISIRRPSSLLREQTRSPRFLSMFREFDDLFKNWPDTLEDKDSNWFSPAVDLVEKDKQYVFSFDVPGMDEKDIKLDITGHTLSISGERKNEKKETGGETSDFKFRSEKSYGFFERSFELPENTEIDQIEASFKNGVLEVVVPKAETPKAKSIPINASENKSQAV